MFDLLRSDIFQNAFVGGTIVAIVAALVGYFLVLRSQAFACEALTDISFAGATGAILLGMSSIFGMIAFAFFSALGLGALGERARGRDVEIGMILSFALGLGVLFLSMFAHHSAGHANVGVNILFGSIVSVNRNDIYLVLGCGVIVLMVLALIFRPLLFVSVDPIVAEARGVPVRFLSFVFLLMLAITTAACVLVVGVLLVAALLIAPAAAAVNFTHQPRHSLFLAVLLGSFITWAGLILAFLGTWHHLPAGFYISTLAALIYFISVLARRKQVRRPTEPLHPCSEICGK
ncbi:MAG TPA: ABC transporter permease [Firmicutes bacterium]|jgi:zinc/manganese transport system permease protein|nr:ABC transporter permease [Bacillota bacterium]